MITAGTIDTSFVIGTGFNNLVYTTVIQTNGKILVGGNFTDYDGNTTNYLTRLNTDGSIDTGFSLSLIDVRILTPISLVRAIALESDGKILVGGSFAGYNGTSTGSIIRLNTDGTPNSYFDSGFYCQSCVGVNSPPAPATIREIVVQSNGKILVGGSFDEYNGISGINYIVRLNYDGTIDSTFNVGTGFNNSVFSIVVLANGNILVGGDFTDYDGTSVSGIVLLSSTGSLLNTFGSGAQNTINPSKKRVQKIKILSNGKILIGGQFNEFNGTPTDYMVLLTSTGLIDTTFNFNSWVINMIEQLDGKILVVGQFNEFNGNSVKNIVRLNPSGSFDDSFIQGLGFNDYVNAISLLQNGNILLGGWFTSYDGNEYNRIIALNNDQPLPDQPRSAGTESTICVICNDVISGETATSVNPPHPVWTDSRGTAVTQLNAITLGGMNGLNS